MEDGCYGYWRKGGLSSGGSDVQALKYVAYLMLKDKQMMKVDAWVCIDENEDIVYTKDIVCTKVKVIKTSFIRI